jgi:hypothetical protein
MSRCLQNAGIDPKSVEGLPKETEKNKKKTDTDNNKTDTNNNNSDLELMNGSEDIDRLDERLWQAYFILAGNYWACEEVSMSEALFLRALHLLLSLHPKRRLEPEIFTKIQETFNQLGKIWFDRGNPQKAFSFLRRSQIMYQRRPETLRKVKLVDNLNLLGGYQLGQVYMGKWKG